MTSNVLNRPTKSPFVVLSYLFMVAFLALVSSAVGAADKSAFRDELDLREEIAHVNFQIARGHDSVANAKNAALMANRNEFGPNPGDELDAAGDLKFWAFEAYQSAAKHWDKLAKSGRPADKSIRAQAALENADIAWEACKRALSEAIQLHRRAQEYFESTNNIERKTAVLGKLARNLQRLLELKR